ncbi:hypothetical protein MHYP_G00071440 [Metynnis hypsauchen]
MDLLLRKKKRCDICSSEKRSGPGKSLPSARWYIVGQPFSQKIRCTVSSPGWWGKISKTASLVYLMISLQK